MVNISYQDKGHGGLPVINTVGGRIAGTASTATVASTGTATDDTSQNIATGGGFSSLFPPISQFDKTQYSNDELPAFEPQASLATVLAYDPATKTVGAVTGIVDAATGKVAALGENPPNLGKGEGQPPVAAWNALKAFKPLSYFVVAL